MSEQSREGEQEPRFGAPQKNGDPWRLVYRELKTRTCEIGSCGEKARTLYLHPQEERGIVMVCDRHLREMVGLPGEVGSP